MTDHAPHNWTPCRLIAGAMALAVLAFGSAVMTGYLEVRRAPGAPPPQAQEEPKSPPDAECFVQRLRAAESLGNGLLDGPNVRWVYKFSGGLPRCWVEVESEGSKQTLGQWNALQHPGFIGADALDRPLLESVEGYVSLISPSPKGKEQTYQLVCGVTRVKYPENPKRLSQTAGFRDVVQFALPAVPLDPGAGAPFQPDAVGTLEDGDESRVVPAGTDRTLNYVIEKVTADGKERVLRLSARFFTAEEVAAAGK